MSRYADPRACPDCRGPLPMTAASCPTCALPLHGATAAELFQVLRHADDLLARLRAPAQMAAPQPVPAAAPPPAARTGVRTTSVPGILLGLGALCLLVAAVIFLAVAWSWLGVGGRTVVLVGLTAAAAGSGLVAARRSLRVAGEALSVVALGLVALDVVGADNAGWWGAPTALELTWLTGGVVAVAALALAGAPYRLVSPQIVAAFAALVAYAGALGATGPDDVVDVVAVLVLAAGAWAGLRTGREVLAYAGGAAALLPWLHLTLDALVRALDEPTLHDVWAGPGLALVAAAVLVLLPVSASRREPTAVALLGGVAATLLTIAVAVPAVDEGATAATGAALAATAAWTAAAWLLRTRDAWRPLPLIPALAAAVPVFVAVLTLSAQSLRAVGSTGPVFARDADVRLGTVDPVAAPWLLLAGVAALVALAWVSVRPPAAWWPAAVTTLGLGAVGSLALLPVPLAVPLAALVGVAGLLLWTGARPVAIAVLLVVTVAALPSALLTGLAALTVAGVGAWCLRPGESATYRLLGGAVSPPAAALAVWAFADVVGLDEALRGYSVLLTVGLLALALPRPEVEAAGWIAALLAVPVAVTAATDPVTATAVHLTVAGALVVASSLVHSHRRVLGWVGGLLLAAATWVRLADLGVEAPEAYTLPSALALLVVGLDRLHRDPATPTARALTPGLLLATVPSLLWCLEDPVTWRAAWLGVACVGLVLAGTLARWHAPIAVGGTVGGLLVVRELAPYAAQAPQWIVIGAAGALLTVVGVTWEHRLAEVRQAAAYFDRLR